MTKLTNATGSNEINMIGQGAVIEGTLRVEGDVRISGRVNGQLNIQGRTIVAQEGVVEGDVIATEAEVAGKIKGELKIEKRLVLRSTAQVEGNIEAGRLVLEEGALFDGECRMGSAAKQPLRKLAPHVLPKEEPSSEVKGDEAARAKAV